MTAKTILSRLALGIALLAVSVLASAGASASGDDEAAVRAAVESA